MEKHRRYILSAACLAAVIMTALAAEPAHAAISGKSVSGRSLVKNVMPSETVSFTASDFEGHAGGELSGVIVTALPDQQAGSLLCGGEPVEPGSVIEADSLGAVCFAASGSGEDIHTSFEFTPVYSDKGADSRSMTVSLNVSDKESSAPVAVDGRGETYCGMALTGKLAAYDPDGDIAGYRLTRAPKYGEVSITGDRYVYTPTCSGSREDSFDFCVIDSFGNTSGDGRVDIFVRRRDDGECLTYSDMADSAAHYAAVRLAEQGVIRGESFGDSSFFSPGQTVSRAEFVAMAAKLRSLPVTTAAVYTGMGDNDDIPMWARPCISAALTSSVVNGEIDESGNRVIRAGDPITRAEAAVIVDRLLDLADDGRVPGYPDAGDIPSWAAQAVVNTVSAGYIDLLDDGSFSPAMPMTREMTASCLYRVMHAENEKDRGFFNIFK